MNFWLSLLLAFLRPAVPGEGDGADAGGDGAGDGGDAGDGAEDIQGDLDLEGAGADAGDDGGEDKSAAELEAARLMNLTAEDYAATKGITSLKDFQALERARLAANPQ